MAKAAVKTPTEATKTAAPPKIEQTAIVTIKQKALSTEVGPRVLAVLAKAQADEEKANAMLSEVGAKRYDILSDTTLALVNAAKADDTINLAAIFSDEKKEKNLLLNQVGLVLGIKEYREVKVGKKGESVQKLFTAKAVEKFFPGEGDTKDTPTWRAKETFRTNWSHQLGQCIKAAVGILEKDMTAKKDPESGTLLLSGPAVQKHFGRAEVKLDEKVKVGVGDNIVELKAKPSFTEIGRIGAGEHGKIVATRRDSRTGPSVDAETAIVQLCATFVSTINKYSGPINDRIKTAFASVKSAIDAKK